MSKTWSALLDPDEIVIQRDSRQRRELTGIDELAQSIRTRGQIQPIVIQRKTNVLIAGERRLTAIRKLRSAELNPLPLLQVKCVYSDELDPAELIAIELEENVKRVDLPWKDNCLAVALYHETQLARDPAWTQGKTAEALGFSAAEISQRIAVAKELRAGNTLVTAAAQLSTAKGIVARATERKEASETSKLLQLVTMGAKTPEYFEDKAAAIGEPVSSHNILNLDFADWAATYNGPKFNFIHCDFPYGVGMHKSDQGSGDSYGTYEDTPEIYWSLVEALMKNLDRFCEDSAHLMFWFSMDYYSATRRMLQDSSRISNPWKVNPFPLIWTKSDGAGIIPDANRGPRRTYETAFLASRGDRKIVKPVANSIASPIQRGRHMSEKPQAVLGHFFRMLVDKHTTLLDPTCGSGSAIRAAHTAGAEHYLGLEINPLFAAHADEALREHIETPQTDLEELLGVSNVKTDIL